MGVSERDYERRGGNWQGQRAGRYSANTWLIVANIAFFLLNAIMGGTLNEYGHFSTYEVTLAGGLEFWRFITFQFLHANIQHIFFNMLGLYIFGPLVEDEMGSRKYMAFYLTCGIFGGLMYLLLNALGIMVRGPFTPTGAASTGWIPLLLFNDPRTPLVGASAGVFGVIMACAYYRPGEIVTLFLLPIEMRMRTMAYGYVLLAGINLFIGGKNQGGDAAHIGGALAGFFFVRNSHLLRDFFDVLSDSREDWKRKKARAGAPPLKFIDPDLEAAEGRVLDKVRREGRESLTQDELEILRRSTELRRKNQKRGE